MKATEGSKSGRDGNLRSNDERGLLKLERQITDFYPFLIFHLLIMEKTSTIMNSTERDSCPLFSSTSKRDVNESEHLRRCV